LTGSEYVITQGRKVVIFQLQDDHSRLAVASLVASSETSQAAIDVFDKGVAARGVPQRLLTDNGIALNPSRRGVTGRLVEHVRSLGVEPITSKPYHPTTQGKNERFHQTLFRYLDQQPLAASTAELQEQVDRFDLIYNTQRPHQGLPGRITPQQAQDATEIAQAPRPRHDTGPIAPAGPSPEPDTTDGPRVRWRRPIGSTGRRLVDPHAPRMEGRWRGTCPAGHTVTRMRRPSVPLACAVCARSFRVENLLEWQYDGATVTPEEIGPRYARTLAALQSR